MTTPLGQANTRALPFRDRAFEVVFSEFDANPFVPDSALAMRDFEASRHERRPLCYESLHFIMAIISQRDLRNDNAEIIRGVERGETYTVTRRGIPVAQIGPIVDKPGLRLIRPARRRTEFSKIRRVPLDHPTEEITADIRGDR